MARDRFTEPGRHVTDDGRVILAWPPTGRFALLWARVEQAFPDVGERCEVTSLLTRWRDEESTLVAYEDDEGWHDVEPDWSQVGAWLGRARG